MQPEMPPDKLNKLPSEPIKDIFERIQKEYADGTISIDTINGELAEITMRLNILTAELTKKSKSIALMQFMDPRIPKIKEGIKKLIFLANHVETIAIIEKEKPKNTGTDYEKINATQNELGEAVKKAILVLGSRWERKTETVNPQNQTEETPTVVLEPSTIEPKKSEPVPVITPKPGPIPVAPRKLAEEEIKIIDPVDDAFTKRRFVSEPIVRSNSEIPFMPNLTEPDLEMTESLETTGPEKKIVYDVPLTEASVSDMVMGDAGWGGPYEIGGINVGDVNDRNNPPYYLLVDKKNQKEFKIFKQVFDKYHAARKKPEQIPTQPPSRLVPPPSRSMPSEQRPSREEQKDQLILGMGEVQESKPEVEESRRILEAAWTNTETPEERITRLRQSIEDSQDQHLNRLVPIRKKGFMEKHAGKLAMGALLAAGAATGELGRRSGWWESHDEKEKIEQTHDRKREVEEKRETPSRKTQTPRENSDTRKTTPVNTERIKKLEKIRQEKLRAHGFVETIENGHYVWTIKNYDGTGSEQKIFENGNSIYHGKDKKILGITVERAQVYAGRVSPDDARKLNEEYGLKIRLPNETRK